ncbi:MAG: hypothetical protein QM680_12505 [Luteolibacter sp.]
MKKFIPLSIGLSLILTNCASTSRLVTNAFGAAGGAALGHSLSDGDPLITAAGAAGGLLVGEAFNHAQDKKTRQTFTQGYDQGRSDAVKQQYWLLVDRQRADADSEGTGLFEFPLPERMPDGTRFHPGATRTLRIGQ